MTEQLLTANRDDLARLLMEHAELGRVVEGVQCRCGWYGQGHADHVADELLAQPIIVATESCPSRSHSDDGWHCAITGEHVMHLNAARTVGWE